MHRALIGIAVLLTCTFALCAPLEVTCQDGLEGYEGTEDFMMYQPSVVAFVNYGASPGLTAGINRWGEHYASIIRFNVDAIPDEAKVLGARLLLHQSAPGFPVRDLVVNLHQLTPANGDWVEGSGDGTRVPTPGAPSWDYRKHDSAKWAGTGGARTPGVDFDDSWEATATVKANSEGWVEFELPARIVQEWVRDASTNTGLHLWPQAAKEKGDVAYFAASELGEKEQRPRLVLTIEREDAVVSALNRARARRCVNSLRAQNGEASDEAARNGIPGTIADRLAESLNAIDALGKSVDDTEAINDEAMAGLLSSVEKGEREIASILTDLPIERARDWNIRQDLAADFALGVESPMVKVFRRDVPFNGSFADTITVKLARNEHEGAQAVIVPIDTDLQQVTWELRGLDAEGMGARVMPVGYVKSRTPALAEDSEPSEWWPDPLLDFLETLDVPRGEAQPLWIDVSTTQSTPAGTYTGELVVGAQNAETKTVKVQVEVFDFAVPVQQHLKTIWGMTEGNFGKYAGEAYDEEHAWKYFDMFLDHRMAAADLYRTKPNGKPGDDSVYHLANVEALKRLKERGSGWWNVGYVLAPKWALEDSRGWGAKTYDEYLAKCVEMFKPEVARLREAGWPQDRMGIYFLDETSDFEALGRAAEVIKQAFPDIPLMTTGYDRSYGIGESAVAKWLDIWVPLTPRYHEDQAKITQGRELGKTAWWYTCCGPRDRKALNWFIQFPLIRTRLLMGVATWKYQPDGFLYYRVAGWIQNDKPIETGPYTDWVPQYHNTLPDGDGMIICAGPDGPLSTVRLENIRDGIEDYEYYWLLQDLIGKARAEGSSAQAKAAAAQAESLLTVPDELLKSIVEYSETSGDLSANREKIARSIEKLSKLVGN